MFETLIAKVDEINAALAKQGTDSRLVIQDIFKNNGNGTGIAIKTRGSNCSPVIRPNLAFWNTDAATLAEQIKESFEDHMLNMDVDMLLDANRIRSLIRPKLLSAENIKELQMHNIPFLSYIGEMVISFYVPVENGVYLNVTEAMLKCTGMTLQQAYTIAVANLEEDIVFRPLYDVLHELTGEVPAT